MQILKDKNKEFQVGEWVWLKLHHYRQKSVTKRLNFKLSQRYYGPCQILERVGPVAYKLQLPSYSKIHPVFHISLLKAFHGEQPIDIPDIPETSTITEVLPKAIVDHREVIVDGQQTQEILVEWEGVRAQGRSHVGEFKHTERSFSFPLFFNRGVLL